MTDIEKRYKYIPPDVEYMEYPEPKVEPIVVHIA
jgi:hypothetical protein